MQKELKEWFSEEKRELPWRDNPTPYRVWISEVMLQQTQAAVVVGYFERWMQKFPAMQDLARAPLPEVMKAWEGLGYYSRARNLHEAAQVMVEKFKGEIPAERKELEKIKGFGPYTVGAILSFAFHQRAAAVDGNVRRVISRLYATDEDISSLTEKFLPEKEPWVAMEALIELGATVCQRKPSCSKCPLNAQCLAYARGETGRYPASKKREKTIYLEREVAIITTGVQVLVRQEGLGKVMGGLYEFPYVEKGESLPFDLKLKLITSLSVVKHGFTRYVATLYPSIWEAGKKDVPGYQWIEWEKVAHLPFSSGHRRILKLIDENFTHRKL